MSAPDVPVELLHGSLHLPSGPTGTADASAHREWLAAQGVLAALGAVEDGAPAHLNLAMRNGRPLVVRDGQLATPFSVLELLTDLTTAAGGLVEVPEYKEFVGDKTLDTRPVTLWPSAQPVLLSRGETAPGFTEAVLVRHSSGTADGWTVTRFDREVPVVGREWMAGDLPGVWLHADRTIALQTAPGQRPQVVLQHFRAPEPVDLAFIGDEPAGYAEALAALRNPQLSASSELAALADEPFFDRVDPVAVAAALQAPITEDWSAGVLAALGLPTLAAEVSEGRAQVPGTEPNPAENVPSLLRSLRDLDQAAERDSGAANLVYRLYGTSTRHPLLALTTIIPEILVGVALLVTLLTADDHPWWHWLVGIFAVACLVDAVIDSVMMSVRLRRRHHPR